MGAYGKTIPEVGARPSPQIAVASEAERAPSRAMHARRELGARARTCARPCVCEAASLQVKSWHCIACMARDAMPRRPTQVCSEWKAERCDRKHIPIHGMKCNGKNGVRSTSACIHVRAWDGGSSPRTPSALPPTTSRAVPPPPEHQQPTTRPAPQTTNPQRSTEN